MYINHIQLPNTNFGIQNLIMKISSFIQMFSAKKKYYMNLVKWSTSDLVIIKTTPLFSLRSLYFHLKLFYPISIHIIEYQNIPLLGQFAVLINQPFWGFGSFRISFLPPQLQHLRNSCLLQYIVLVTWNFQTWKDVITR